MVLVWEAPLRPVLGHVFIWTRFPPCGTRYFDFILKIVCMEYKPIKPGSNCSFFHLLFRVLYGEMIFGLSEKLKKITKNIGRCVRQSDDFKQKVDLY